MYYVVVKQPNAPVEAGYRAFYCEPLWRMLLAEQGPKVTFDEKTQEVMAGGKVFKY
jgi:hypothetical protein